MSTNSNIDEINGEIDRRKLQKLMYEGFDIANAPIYIECPNCKAQELSEVGKDNCDNCGVDYDR